MMCHHDTIYSIHQSAYRQTHIDRGYINRRNYRNDREVRLTVLVKRSGIGVFYFLFFIFLIGCTCVVVDVDVVGDGGW